MVRVRSIAAILAVAATMAVAGTAGAQDAEPAERGPTLDFEAYVRNGFNKPDEITDNPRYPAATIRTDQSHNSTFFGKFGGDTHRLRASKRPGIFSIFGFR